MHPLLVALLALCGVSCLVGVILAIVFVVAAGKASKEATKQSDAALAEVILSMASKPPRRE